MSNEKPTTIRFPADLKKKLRVFAAERGITMESVAAQAFTEFEEKCKAGPASTKELGVSTPTESGEPPVPPAAQPAYDLIQRDISAMSKTLEEIAARLGMEDLRGRYAGPRAKRERDRALVGGEPARKSRVDILADGEFTKGGGARGKKD